MIRHSFPLASWLGASALRTNTPVAFRVGEIGAAAAGSESVGGLRKRGGVEDGCAGEHGDRLLVDRLERAHAPGAMASQIANRPLVNCSPRCEFC